MFANPSEQHVSYSGMYVSNCHVSVFSYPGNYFVTFFLLREAIKISSRFKPRICRPGNDRMVDF